MKQGFSAAPTCRGWRAMPLILIMCGFCLRTCLLLSLWLQVSAAAFVPIAPACSSGHTPNKGPFQSARWAVPFPCCFWHHWLMTPQCKATRCLIYVSGKLYSAMIYSAAGHGFEAAKSTIHIKQGNSKQLHTKQGGQKCDKLTRTQLWITPRSSEFIDSNHPKQGKWTVFNFSENEKLHWLRFMLSN